MHGVSLAGTQLLALIAALAGWATGNDQVMWMGAIGIALLGFVHAGCLGDRMGHPPHYLDEW